MIWMLIMKKIDKNRCYKSCWQHYCVFIQQFAYLFFLLFSSIYPSYIFISSSSYILFFLDSSLSIKIKAKLGGILVTSLQLHLFLLLLLCPQLPPAKKITLWPLTKSCSRYITLDLIIFSSLFQPWRWLLGMTILALSLVPLILYFWVPLISFRFAKSGNFIFQMALIYIFLANYTNMSMLFKFYIFSDIFLLGSLLKKL